MDLTRLHRRTDRVIPTFPFHPIPYLKSCNRNMKSIILVKKKTLRQRVHHRMLKRWKTQMIGKKIKQFIYCFYMYVLSLKNKDDYYTCFTLSSHSQEPDISPPPWQLNGKKLEKNSSPLTYFNTASTISFHPWTLCMAIQVSQIIFTIFKSSAESFCIILIFT